MKVYRSGSAIKLFFENYNKVNHGVEIPLNYKDAETLLMQLASMLPYRVLRALREVEVAEVDVSKKYLVVKFPEGRNQRKVKVYFDVIKAHLDAMRIIGLGRGVSKREYARLVIEELVSKTTNDALKKLCYRNLPLDWEKFIGRRTDYYILYYVPLLLLRSAGCVDLKPTSIRVIEIPKSLKHLVNMIKSEE